MISRDDTSPKIDLRKQAEVVLQAKMAQQSEQLKALSPEALRELFHELHVHQIELELQNEELRQTQIELDIAKTRYFELYDLAPVAYLTIDTNGLIKQTNLAAATLLGLSRRSLLNKPLSKFIFSGDLALYYTFYKLLIESREHQVLDLRILRNDGIQFWAHLDALVAQDEVRLPILRITLTDITELIKTEIALRDSIVHIQSLMDSALEAENAMRIAAKVFESQEGIYITDADNVILRANRAVFSITGYTEKDLVGQKPSIFSSGRQSAEFYAEMWKIISETGIWDGEIWNRRKNGEIYPQHLTISSVKNINGRITNYVATLTDITMSQLAAEKIKFLAFYDPLTQLPNRILLRDRLTLALASSQRNKYNCAILFIDLDNFKTLNDTLGHDMGDLLLQQVAERLLNSVRDGDTVARLGGDEFVVMLEDLSESINEAVVQVEAIGNKIINSINQDYHLNMTVYRCTSSIGITLFKNEGQTLDEVLKQADIAMYQAKARGRNTLRFFDQQMQDNISSRVSLERDLEKALAENQFMLYYQPQIQSINHINHIIGSEALIRWYHPVRGFVHPYAFIPLAEENSLILSIGQWVLETACAQIKKWENNEYTKDLTISVNVSARQFHEIDFVETVRRVMENSAINPSRVKLELTETVVLDDIKEATEKMNALRELGVRFSMDDFGTGYSSLAYLSKLPMDQIKIDQSFVFNIV
ncbi:MAG: EAL domain-containing protein [Methylococcales bacterium]